MQGWLGAQGMKLALDTMTVALAISPSRWLITQALPKPGQGPTEPEQKAGFYDLRFWGQTRSGHSVMIQVAGDQDPGYGSTAKIVAQAGQCLAKDKPLPAGGFWTPATIFGQDLIQRLMDYAGLTFAEIN
jgi:short subunit dehydrogenase-like uncharacterized protein